MKPDARKLGEEALKEGKNIASALRDRLGSDRNTPEIIEIAYDLQAGSYIQFAEDNSDYVRSYARQLAHHLRRHVKASDVLLDIGAGELTNLSFMIDSLDIELGRVIACDISEPRLQLGRLFAERHMGSNFARLETLKADIAKIPLGDQSVDVLTSNHAIEPNGGREEEVLRELLRVSRRKLVLFEPCFEIASEEAQDRMASHAYIRGLGDAAQRAGGILESMTPLEIVNNPLNPTVCFVIAPALPR